MTNLDVKQCEKCARILPKTANVMTQYCTACRVKVKRAVQREAVKRQAESRKHDLCSDDGAWKLKRRIEKYWQERGHEVRVSLKKGGFTSAMRSARSDVRSDMINGLPRQ